MRHPKNRPTLLNRRFAVYLRDVDHPFNEHPAQPQGAVLCRLCIDLSLPRSRPLPSPSRIHTRALLCTCACLLFSHNPSSYSIALCISL
ncbi:hypothetical protein ARMSODRAFT_169729 [Armillaria solidipes]|uniref:Uncharacterized protein n=1 Tax=Armillaria solidipes TaxID=1076256 RepID=A0A2H3B320_9AGAR|nr:hypothetical protein ARMSODRAFT_170016 [Armillaria solidipes]PBK58236.1 hypothetical protein ARMSODRAFT_169729 [Armillaria solidipes]